MGTRAGRKTVEDSAPKDLITFLDYWLVKRAPFQLPDRAKEFIVRYGPWIAIVLLVISLPVILMALGISAVLLPLVAPYHAPGFGFAVLVLFVELALDVAALPGLFARKMSGWRLIFYARIVAIAHSLLSGAIVGAIVGGVIGLYILFQVRGLYHERSARAASGGAA